MVVIINPTGMLRYGLAFCKVDGAIQDRRCEASNVRQFKAVYGKHPVHLCRVWRDLQVNGILTIGPEAFGMKNALEGFLAANNYLRCYQALDVQSALLSNIPQNLLGELRWAFTTMIARLKVFKIKMPTNAGWERVKMLLTVDGTHMRTDEPRDDEMRRNPKNFSYKNNYSGLNYQIATHIFKNQICYANTGDPGSVHDMTAMRAEFIALLPEGARVIADAGYTGKSELEKKLFSVGSSFDTQDVKTFKKRARARQESVNKRLKQYLCMANKFTDGVDRHQECFAACLVLTQYSIEDTSTETGEPVMTV